VDQIPIQDWFETTKLGCIDLPKDRRIVYVPCGCNSVEEVAVLTRKQTSRKKKNC